VFAVLKQASEIQSTSRPFRDQEQDRVRLRLTDLLKHDQTDDVAPDSVTKAALEE
jgi:hypothetical protein